jgi:NAD(P)H-dependent FMN reductase
MVDQVDILLISGSTRDGSTNTAVLRTAQEIAPTGVSARRYDVLTALPHFNPDDDTEPLPPAVAELRQRLGAADAVLFCTPEYAGALPGSFKNLLDWTVGGGQLTGKPVAWVNASWAATGAANAHASLGIVLGYLDVRLITEACQHIPVGRPDLGADGLVSDPGSRARITESLTALAKAARSD